MSLVLVTMSNEYLIVLLTGLYSQNEKWYIIFRE